MSLLDDFDSETLALMCVVEFLEWHEIYCHSQTYMARNPTDHIWETGMEQLKWTWNRLSVIWSGLLGESFFGLYFNEGLGRSAAGHTLAPRHLFLWYFPVLSLEDVIRKW